MPNTLAPLDHAALAADAGGLGVAEVAQPVREREHVTVARQAAVRAFVPIHSPEFDALIEGLGASCRAKVREDGW